MSDAGRGGRGGTAENSVTGDPNILGRTGTWTGTRTQGPGLFTAAEEGVWREEARGMGKVFQNFFLDHERGNFIFLYFLSCANKVLCTIYLSARPTPPFD